MTHQETAALLAAVAMLYPGRMTPDEAAVPLWTEMLADLEPGEATRALRAHAATSPHPPCIADIRNRVAEERSPAPDIGAAWEEVRRAISRCGRDHEPPWSSPRVAAAVSAIGWRMICDSDIDQAATIRAQFERYFRAGLDTARREANIGALEAVRESSGAIAAGDAVRGLLGQSGGRR